MYKPLRKHDPVHRVVPPDQDYYVTSRRGDIRAAASDTRRVPAQPIQKRRFSRSAAFTYSRQPSNTPETGPSPNRSDIVIDPGTKPAPTRLSNSRTDHIRRVPDRCTI